MGTDFAFLGTLSESRLFPSATFLRRYDAQEVADLAYLHVAGLRILAAEPSSEAWARQYARRSAPSSGFAHWRTDASDLYALLHALVDEDTEFADTERNHHRAALRPGLLQRWLVDVAHDQDGESETRRLFTGLDTQFRVNDGSMKAVRRLAQSWPDLDGTERRLCMTRLLQMLRARAARGELLPMLTRLARQRDLELHGVCDRETGGNCEEPVARRGSGKMAFLLGLAAGGVAGAVLAGKTHARESASSGGTSSASIATVAGGLGAGFDPNGDHGVYQDSRKKKKEKPPLVIRRGAPPA